MDKASSVIAAFEAGKFPTQKQIDAFIGWLLDSKLIQVESVAGSPELTAQGKILAVDLRELLSAYKALGSEKNKDELLQEIFWHLSQADLSQTSIGAPMDKGDVRRVGASLRTALSVVWGNVSSEGTGLFQDFASFARLSLADAAEFVEESAAAAKDSLRELEDEVQAGERNPITGTRKRPASADPENADARVKFEKTLDQVKVAGSKAIGAGQSVKASAEHTAERTNNRLREAYYKVCDRAQTDSEYCDAITTIFDLAQKWLDKTLDTAADVNQGTTVETFIDDQTGEQHVTTALRQLAELLERFAGGKKLDHLFAALRTCAADVRSDPDTQAWFDMFFEHARRSLEEPGYLRSEEAETKSQMLRDRWTELLDVDSDVGRKWKKDVEQLKKEAQEFQAKLENEPGLVRLRKAHAKMSSDLGEAAETAGSVGLQAAMSNGAWMWQDVLNVYSPRVLGEMKGVPIPRTEYKDPETEFVLEDLDVSTLAILPGHLYVRTITDVDITALEDGTAQTAYGAMTHIHAKGVQLALKEVSFYYLDKTTTVGPAEFTGIMELTLPPQGLDIDLKVRLLPNTEKGLAERARLKAFHKIEKVSVTVSDDFTLDVRQSNHPILLSVFRPALRAGLRNALARTLEEQIRAALEFADGLAWDIGNRAVVFGDAGLGRGPSLIAAMWSEVGRFSRQKQQSHSVGLTSGWQATGTGIVKHDAGGVTIAMGAEPQVLSGDKKGPKERLAEPVGDKVQRAADRAGAEMDVDMEDAASKAQDVKEQVKDVAQEGVKQVRSFKGAVDAKRERELATEGWKSSAFDV